MSDGWDDLYTKRYARAQGYAIDCQAICTEISLGIQVYSVAKLLHQAVFINGSLVNMETWPHCTDKRMDMFERAEQSLFRKVLAAHSKTPVECLYLKLGIIPFRYHLMARRIAYYHEIMNRSDDEVTKAVVLRQKINKIHGDFYVQVARDLSLLGIDDDEVVSYSKGKLKDVAHESVEKLAFRHLLQ